MAATDTNDVKGRMGKGVIGIGVVGYGYWGPNLVRNFASTVRAQVIAICDMDSSKLDQGKRLYPSVGITKTFRDLLTDNRIDAIAISTPVSTHYELALAALKAGKHPKHRYSKVHCSLSTTRR